MIQVNNFPGYLSDISTLMATLPITFARVLDNTCVWADISCTSPQKLMIFILDNTMYRSNDAKQVLFDFENRNTSHEPSTGSNTHTHVVSTPEANT